MVERDLERLFDRFRSHGDAAALGEIFDATAANLLRIARRLARDRAEAEDLVQATFLAAIEQAQSFDADRALVPWLVGILVRQAGLARRRRERSIGLDETLAAREEPTSTAMADREFAEAVARALERLSPAEREVLVPLLLHEKRAVEIARELEKRPDTVHMRIHRGLARLRQLLPAGFGLGLVAAFFQRRALARAKREVMNMARRSVHPSASASAISAAASSTVVETFFASKLALAGVLVVACAAWIGIARPWARFGGGPTAGQESPVLSQRSPEPAPAVLTRTTGSSEARVPLDPTSTSSSTAALAASSPSKWLVKGQIRGLEPGETLPSTLTVEPIAPAIAIGGEHSEDVMIGAFGSGSRSAALTAVVPTDGSFEIDVSSLFTGATAKPPHELELSVDHPRYLVGRARLLAETGQVVVAPNGETIVELRQDVELKLAAVVRGQVFAPPGSGASKCELSIHRLDGSVPSVSAEEACECASGGEFRLRVGASSAYVLLAASAGSEPETIEVSASLGQERALGPIQLEPGLAISGTATAGGVARARATVRARAANVRASARDLVRRDFRWEGHAFVRIASEARADERGSYTIGGLPAGTFELSAFGGGMVDLDFSTPSAKVRVEAPAQEVEVPIACAVLELHIAGVAPGSPDLLVMFTDPESSMSLAKNVSCAPIRRIGVSPDSQVELGFRIDGYAPISASYAAPGAGEERIESLQFVPNALSKLRVRLSSDDGELVTRAGFGFFSSTAPSDRDRGAPDFALDATGSNGEFALDSVRAGNYTVLVHTGGTFFAYAGYHREGEFQVQLSPGADETRALMLSLGGRIRVNLVSSSSERLLGPAKLLDSAGRECTTQFCHVEPGAEGARTWTSSADMLNHGANDTFPNLEPGEYRVQVSREPRSPIAASVSVVAGKTSEVTIDLDAP